MRNGSITDRYTLYTLIVRVLHALYWEVMDVLPEEVLALRKSAEHVVNFTGKDDSVTTSRLVSKDAEARQRKDCNQTVCCRSSH